MRSAYHGMARLESGVIRSVRSPPSGFVKIQPRLGDAYASIGYEMKIRLPFLGAALAVMMLGLASRRFRPELPAFLAEFSGDTLWALMVYLLVSCCVIRGSAFQRVLISAGIALTIELSQLYHAPWIDAIRQTTLGGLVLGFGFLWTDLICYAVGILIGACFDVWVLAPKRLTQSV